jgi:outer membrane protein TolC
MPPQALAATPPERALAATPPERALAAAPPESAPTAPRGAAAPVSISAALEAAWQRAVAARESEGQRRRAGAEAVAAGSLWAAPPSLALGYRSDRLQQNTGSRETEVAVALPLWLPGQRSARASTASSAQAQALAAEQAARWRLAGEVREAAWQLAAAQAEAAQATGLATALQQLAEDVQRRVNAGDLARADLLAAQAEQLAAQAQQTETGQRLQAARAQWTLLTGLAAMPALAPPSAAAATTAGTPGTPGTEGTASTAPTPVSVADALAVHPELELARQTTVLARQRLALLRHSRREAPELSLGLRQEVGGRGQAAQGSVAVALRLPFGTDARNAPLEAAAASELDLAETQAQRLRERLLSEAATARQAEGSGQAQLQAETARARLLRERAGLIDASFRAGETPLPELLRALAAAAQADAAVARQSTALGLAQARLQQTLGQLP